MLNDSLLPIIQIEMVNKTFNSKKALENISIKIWDNDCVGVIGKNGAGKSTLLKILVGLLQADSGFLEFSGIKGLSFDVKKKIGFYLGSQYIPKELTGRQYLGFLNQIYHENHTKKKSENIEDMFNYFFDDLNALDTPISNYSMGMVQKIGICGALIHRPNLLILDEPFTGLDPVSCITLIDFLKFYGKNNIIIISSHDLSYVEKLCNHIVLLDSGLIKYDGKLENFTKDNQVNLEASFLEAVSHSTISKEINWINQ